MGMTRASEESPMVPWSEFSPGDSTAPPRLMRTPQSQLVCVFSLHPSQVGCRPSVGVQTCHRKEKSPRKLEAEGVGGGSVHQREGSPSPVLPSQLSLDLMPWAAKENGPDNVAFPTEIPPSLGDHGPAGHMPPSWAGTSGRPVWTRDGCVRFLIGQHPGISKPIQRPISETFHLSSCWCHTLRHPCHFFRSSTADILALHFHIPFHQLEGRRTFSEIHNICFRALQAPATTFYSCVQRDTNLIHLRYWLISKIRGEVWVFFFKLIKVVL